MFDFLRGVWGAITSTRVDPYSSFDNPQVVGVDGTLKSLSKSMALRYGAFFACVRLNSETIAGMSLLVRERVGEYEERALPNHPLQRLLTVSPSRDTIPATLFGRIVSDMQLHGDGFVRKKSSIGSRVTSLEYLRADKRFLEVRRRTNGEIYYEVENFDGSTETLEYDEVWHIPGFNLGGDRGVSIVEYATRSLAVAVSTQQFKEASFKHGLRPEGVLKTSQILKPAQRARIRKSLLGPMADPSNKVRGLILEAGMDYSPISLKPEDAQMIESEKFSVEDICRWAGVPPMLVGHTGGTQLFGNSLYNGNLFFLTYGLQPRMTSIAQSAVKHLLEPSERGTVFLSHDVSSLLRLDAETQARIHTERINNGTMSPNRAAAQVGLPPNEGGDEPFVDMNRIPISLAAQAAQARMQKEGGTQNEQKGFESGS